jgi:hypothetical protein
MYHEHGDTPNVSLAPWEWAGVRETVMAAATYILRGGADAMAVSANRRAERVDFPPSSLSLLVCSGRFPPENSSDS